MTSWSKFGGVLILSLFVFVMSYTAMQTGEERISTLPSIDNCRKGDVLLLGSSTGRGRLLKLLDTQSDYMHVGMIDKFDGECYLIHADPQRGCVVRDRLGAYFASNKVERALLLRIRCEVKSADAAIAFAREQSFAARDFDNTFRYGEGDGLYCTELVLRSWSSANVELIPNVKKGDRIFPSRLLESNLIYPILHCHGGSVVASCETARNQPVCLTRVHSKQGGCHAGYRNVAR